MVVGLDGVVEVAAEVAGGGGVVVGGAVGAVVDGVATLVAGVSGVAAVVAGFGTSALRFTPGGTRSLSMACSSTPLDAETSGPVTVASFIITVPLPTTTFSADPSTDLS